jgi:hypothetical protein
MSRKAKRRKRIAPPALLGEGVTFIDPLHSRSMVGYTIGRSRTGYITADVRLMDCDRQIIWRLDHAKGHDGAAKLTAAIKMLERARRAWSKATSGVKPQ